MLIGMDSQYFEPREKASAAELEDLEITLGGKILHLKTAEGVFSAKRLDKATEVLLQLAPQLPEKGKFLDLGCGWGPLAISLGLESSQAEIYATDISPRAIDLTKRNCKIAQVEAVVDLPENISAQLETESLDVIWSNPPIRVGKAALHELFLTWLPYLKPEGYGIFVVGKNLGADSLAKWLKEQGYQVEKLGSRKGFRVLKVSK